MVVVDSFPAGTRYVDSFPAGSRYVDTQFPRQPLTAHSKHSSQPRCGHWILWIRVTVSCGNLE